MTPMRDINRYEQRDEGAMLTLSCGHGVWVAGMGVAGERYVACALPHGRPTTWPCSSSPCYQWEKAMGRLDAGVADRCASAESRDD